VYPRIGHTAESWRPAHERDRLSQVTLTGKEAWAFIEELDARNAKERAARLARAKADAAARGKEPFDLARLESMADTSSEGRMDPEESRRARFEEMYYVHYPDLMTIEDFAAVVEVLNKW
jgi:hypothetical protein